MRFVPRRRVVLASAAALLTAGTTAKAQGLMPSGTGLSVGAQIGAARMSTESDGVTTTRSGLAPRVELAYGATARVGLVGALQRRTAEIERTEFTVRAVELGLRYLGSPGRPIRPFLEGGLAIRKFSLDGISGEITADNVGPWSALGFEWMQRGRTAVDVAATYGRTTFKSFKAQGTPAAVAPVSVSEIGLRVGARGYWRGR